MPDLTFFEIFAECSIAFAGFGAVHAVLRGARGPRSDFRAFTVVSHGLLCFFLSIAPLLLALASLAAEVLWRVASGIGFAGATTLLLSGAFFDRRMTRRGHPPQALMSIRLAQASAALAALAMLANLIGWPGAPNHFPYAAGLVLVMWAGAIALLHSFLRPIELWFKGEASHPSPDEAGPRDENPAQSSSAAS